MAFYAIEYNLVCTVRLDFIWYTYMMAKGDRAWHTLHTAYTSAHGFRCRPLTEIRGYFTPEADMVKCPSFDKALR